MRLKVSFVFMNPQRRIAELTLSELSAALILGHLVLRAARNNDAESNLRSISLRSACNKNILNCFLFFFLYLSIKARINVLTHVAEQDQIKTCTEEGIDPNAACWHHNVALPDTFSTECGRDSSPKFRVSILSVTEKLVCSHVNTNPTKHLNTDARPASIRTKWTEWLSRRSIWHPGQSTTKQSELSVCVSKLQTTTVLYYLPKFNKLFYCSFSEALN